MLFKVSQATWIKSSSVTTIAVRRTTEYSAKYEVHVTMKDAPPFAKPCSSLEEAMATAGRIADTVNELNHPK